MMVESVIGGQSPVTLRPSQASVTPGGKLGLRLVVVVIVRQMREKSSAGADAPGGRQGFIQAHVRRMRLVTQCIQHRDLHAANLVPAPVRGTSLQSLK